MTDYLAFSLADHYFALPIADIHDITKAGHITPVPLAARAVCGLLNRRGQIITVFDAAAYFGLPQDRDAHHIIIAHLKQGLVGIRADSVHHVFHAGTIHPVPGQAAWHVCTHGIAYDDDHPVTLLNTSSLIERILS